MVEKRKPKTPIPEEQLLYHDVVADQVINYTEAKQRMEAANAAGKPVKVNVINDLAAFQRGHPHLFPGDSQQPVQEEQDAKEGSDKPTDYLSICAIALMVIAVVILVARAMLSGGSERKE